MILQQSEAESVFISIIFPPAFLHPIFRKYNGMSENDSKSGKLDGVNENQNSDQGGVQSGEPVMCCHPATRGNTTTGEGQAPSTPRRKRKEKRRMSIKRFSRVTPEEDALIVARAAAVGLEPSSYLRVQALGLSRVRPYRCIRADWDELRTCMGVINRAGNVVNQLVKYLYTGGTYSAAADAALLELRHAARIIIERLGRS
jgi:hypothetical protein